MRHSQLRLAAINTNADIQELLYNIVLQTVGKTKSAGMYVLLLCFRVAQTLAILKNYKNCLKLKYFQKICRIKSDILNFLIFVFIIHYITI